MKIIKIKLPDNESIPSEQPIIDSLKWDNNSPKTAPQIAEFWQYNWEEGLKHELPGLDVHSIEAKLIELCNLGVIRKVPRRGKDENGYEFFTMKL